MDPKEYSEKLCRAINAGFIQVSQDPDGLLRYSLTQDGLEQWKKESPNGGWRKMVAMMQHLNIRV